MKKLSGLESWAIERIIPYADNAKEHTPEQVAKIARSIEEYGFDQPIVVDADGVIIKGHGRHLAAQSLGREFVPVIVRRDLSPEQVRAARLADNRVAMGDYNVELLQKELAALAATDLDMTALGFDDRELSFLTESLDDMNMDALIEDLDEESVAHSENIEQSLKDARGQAVPIAEAFGFRTLTTEQARIVREFMAQVRAGQQNQEASGAEALVDFFADVLAND
jgi:ParB-like chromosome segregation protein Spo0J